MEKKKSNDIENAMLVEILESIQELEEEIENRAGIEPEEIKDVLDENIVIIGRTKPIVKKYFDMIRREEDEKNCKLLLIAYQNGRADERRSKGNVVL